MGWPRLYRIKTGESCQRAGYHPRNRQAGSGKEGFCVAAPTVDRGEIVRMANTVQEVGEGI